MVVEHGAGGRQVRVMACPLGVPFERFGHLAESAPPMKIDKPKEAQVVLSVDTLDYTKGLLHRISAFEKLLEKYHIHRGKVTLVQVCLPSRHQEGQAILEQLETRQGELQGGRNCFWH